MRPFIFCFFLPSSSVVKRAMIWVRTVAKIRCHAVSKTGYAGSCQLRSIGNDCGIVTEFEGVQDPFVEENNTRAEENPDPIVLLGSATGYSGRVVRT